jgi:peptidoglycan/xylan/chitin deacetylase (PgdA/CDA1 family)
MNDDNNGKFVISLDFELFWGVWDVASIDDYGTNILGVQKVIPTLLNIFKEYNVKATFATVGFLFAKNKEELLQYNPTKRPQYENDQYNVYKKQLLKIGDNEIDDPYHYGFSLLQQIKNSSNEIGTHTYSHYYCLEEGQTANDFEKDIEAAVSIGKNNGITPKSIVFPRNQINEDYLEILYKLGIKSYRGNPTSWIYKPRKYAAEIPFIRLCRLMDTYLPISGNNIHTIVKEADGMPLNIAASRFLKPYTKLFSLFESLKILRIKREMTAAAKQGKLYHIWWHPHNFGVNLKENINNLTKILAHYKKLATKYGFSNFTMDEIANKITQ